MTAMINRVVDDEVALLIRNVFATDEDLYLRRWHGDDKTLDGLVSYTMSALFDGFGDVEVYCYGDEYGFIAVDKTLNVLRSFGIKKQHRDKKEMFFEALGDILGDVYFACVWSDNINAIRFFEKFGGVMVNEDNGGVLYKFNKDKICH